MDKQKLDRANELNSFIEYTKRLSVDIVKIVVILMVEDWGMHF